MERNRIFQNACELTHSETERDSDRTEEQTRKSVRTDGDAVKNDTDKMEKRQGEPRGGHLL